MSISRQQIQNVKDFTLRSILLAFYDQHDVHNQVTGTNWLKPTNSPQQPASKPPAQGSLSVEGANGIFSIVVTNPSESINKTLYIEISYCDQVGFRNGVVVLPVTTAQRQNYPYPGVTKFFRARWSYDQNNWSGYYTLTTAVASGLQSSSASENNTPLNQTNYANIDSVAVGGTANVRVYGKAGPTTQFPSVKGAVETIQPSATIVNVPLSSTQILSLDGEANYQVRGTLPEVFADELTPIGAVSVVGSGPVTLPTITPVFGAGGSIVGYNVTSGGSGATGPYTLGYASVGGGTGATFGAQTIIGGVLISVAPGNPGSSYSGGTTITVAGGTFAGGTGGGQSIGGNNGRLVYGDSTTGGL